MINFEDHFDKYYLYKIDVTDVYDGDTITCTIHLGLNVILHDQKIRLFGISAPEVKGSEKDRGILSRDYLKQNILNCKLDLYTIKDKKEKYGRWLGIIVKDGVIINKLLLDNNYATEYLL